MADRRWRILLVEDDEDDYILTRDMLAEARGNRYHLEWASNYQKGRELIGSHPFDAVLMDYELGPHNGLDLIREMVDQGLKAPVILLTGRGSYDIDLEAMQVGVTDYLAKNDASPATLERTIRYAILQKRNEEMLRAARDELETRVQERTHEITEKNRALEAEILERKRIQLELAELQRRLIDRTEIERLELARELHDGPMQELYGIIFQLDMLSSALENDEVKKSLTEMKDKINEVNQSLRVISRELRPPALAPYGLEKAIRSHADQLQQAHPDLAIHLFLDPDGKELPETVRLALYRIYQTAITNVIRHAQAAQVDIYLRMTPDEVMLEIKDNGRGFRAPVRWLELARQDHLGLVGARERAEAAGGSLEIYSQPGKGTLIRVVVPRKQEPAPVS